MDARVVRSILLALALLAMACSEQRPLYPDVDELAALLHEPYENQEAEELALQLSGKFIAPHQLYDRIASDIDEMRSQWSDSVPSLVGREFGTRFVPGEISIHLHDELDPGVWVASSTGLDTLRNQYELDSIEIADNRIILRSRYRLNSNFLLDKFERLSGVCRAEVVPQYRWFNGAVIDGDSIFYLHGISSGLCYGSHCTPTYMAWFLSDAAGFHFLGIQRYSRGDTIPDQFKRAYSHWGSYNRNEIPDSIRFRDETPPARATDVNFIGNQVGRAGMISFTATGDDGNEGAAYSATVCVSVNPMITDENFNTVGYSYIKVNPGFSGDEHLLSFDKLYGDRTNYYAVRFIDCNQNLSGVSNIAESRNIWLNGWTYFNSINSPLPNDRITGMIRDKRGRLWLATNNGVACKDGDQWQVYQTANSAVPYDLITSIAEGPDGDIWIGTPNGLGRFDGEVWRSLTPANSDVPKHGIISVEVTNDGDVWLGCGQFGLVHYDHKTWTVYNQNNSSLNGAAVNTVFSDSRGVLWVGTNWGVTRIDGDAWTAYDPTNSGLVAHYSVSFFEDSDGQVWCGSSTDGVSWFDGSTWYSHQIDSWNVKSFAQFANGTLWIGATGGIWKHKSDEWLGLSGATTGLPTNKCTGLVTEGSEVLWIATADKGLCRWDLKVAKLD